jgi:hypothetical protein
MNHGLTPLTGLGHNYEWRESDHAGLSGFIVLLERPVETIEVY